MDLSKTIPIKTERLLLDKFNETDWEYFYKMELSPEQHRFNRETYSPRSEKEIKDLITELSGQNFDELNLPFLLAIRLKDGQLIGFIGFKNGTLKEKGQAELYYSLYKDHWNNGYGTEALYEMVRFGFGTFKLHKIFAGCDIDNFASKRIMEKVGMRFESYWRKDRIRNGKWNDGLGFSILEEDMID